MPSIDVTFAIDVAEPGAFRRLESLPHEVERLTRDAINDIALAAESEAIGLAPFRTGNLKRNIGSEPARLDQSTGGLEATVGVRRTAPYGVWVHQGTGVFGARHRPIVPVAGNVLAFRAYPTGILVRTRSVKGQVAKPFIEGAFRIVNAGYAPLRLGKLANDIGNLPNGAVP